MIVSVLPGMTAHHQGAVESGWFFALGCNKALQKLNTTLEKNGGDVMTIVDDDYAMGHPSHIFQAR